MNRWDNYGELYHHGILGQIWGRRRWQNEDGSLTEAGRAHYGYGNAKESNRHQESMADKEYRSTMSAERMNRDNVKRDIRLKQLDVDKVRASDELNRQKDKSSLEKARLDYADKRAVEKAKLDQLKEKSKLEKLKYQQKDRADLLKAHNDYKIAKLQANTEREAMRRDFAEARRQQDYDYTYNWANMQNDYRYERAQQRVDKMVKDPGFGSRLVSGLIIAGGSAAVSAWVTNRLTKPNP